MVGRARGGRRGNGGGGPLSSLASAPLASFLGSSNVNHLDTIQSNGSTRPHFSLSEGARNTDCHYSWNSDLKLRHSRVAFISAGACAAEDLKPLTKKSGTSGEAIESLSQETSKVPAKDSRNRSTEYPVTPDVQMSNMTLKSLRYASTPQKDSGEEATLISKQGSIKRGLKSVRLSDGIPSVELNEADEPMHADLVAPLIRRPSSPTVSDTSEEVIIFAGRQRSCDKADQKHVLDTRSGDFDAQNTSKPYVPCISLAATIDGPQIVEAQRRQITPEQRLSSFSFLDHKREPRYLSCLSKAIASRSGRRRRCRYLSKETEDEGFLDDYAANVRDSFDLEALNSGSALNQRDLSGADVVESQDVVESLPTRHVKRDSLTKSEEWDNASFEDFDESRTSMEVLESIEKILSRREGPSGVQYLVTGAGCTIDDARWFSVSSLISHGAKPLIREFEDDADLDHLLYSSIGSNASLDLDEQIAQDLQEDSDGKEDEKGLVVRRKVRMTDERVARLLSKQEELGLGSDSLMLFDGGDVGTDSPERVEFDGMWDRALSHRAPFRSHGQKCSRSNFPFAKANTQGLAQDPYNGFDVMDQQRSSLRKRAKSLRGKFSMELSDSELEQSIYTAWEKDRTKKKKRKQEREELRAQGLLGKKNKLDLKAKYSEGISMAEVKKEIRDFLFSTMESLPLPPLAHAERKIVHEIANVFKLKSKSFGGGKYRFPILYKTPRTMEYNEETLKAAESVLSSGRFIPRTDRAKRKDALVDRGRRGGVANAGVSYRDGEVVGAAAPEIGQENRGRTMLEKMGWSTGTALGALNNRRGLVLPVAQVVKTSRSGLG